MTTYERVMARTTITESCWLWTGATAKGWGQIMDAGKCVPCHRVVYEHVNGPIPDGLQIDHLCRVRNCVNPMHLEAVTSRTNTLRGFGPSALNATKTHCHRGHPFTPENTRIKGPGWRMCRACQRVQNAASRKRRAARRRQAA